MRLLTSGPVLRGGLFVEGLLFPRAAERASLGLCVCGEKTTTIASPPPAESRISAESQTSLPVALSWQLFL